MIPRKQIVTVIGPTQERKEWWGLAGVFALIYTCGVIGLIQAHPLDSSRWIGGLLNQLYGALLMFGLDSGFYELENPNVYLNIARFGAPLLIMVTFFKVGVRLLFQKSLIDWVRKKQGHTVICGLGPIGHAILDRCCGAGQDVVVICSDPAEDLRAVSRRYGIPILAGNATDPRVLSQGAVGRAARLVAVSESDLENLDIENEANTLARQLGDVSWTQVAHVHIGDLRLLQRLRAHIPPPIDRAGFDVNVFNTYAVAARRLYEECPLYEFADLRAQDRVHVVMVGYGPMAEAILIQTVLLCHFKDLDRPKITIVDREANQYRQDFLARYPEAVHAADIIFIDHNMQALKPDAEGVGFLKQIGDQKIAGITAVFCCSPEPLENVCTALTLREMVTREQLWRAPFFVNLEGQKITVGHFTRSDQTEQFERVMHPIGLLDEIYANAEVGGGEPDRYAKGLHNRYLRDNEARARAAGESAAQRWRRQPNAQEWRRLPETYRIANRASADHIRVKLASAGYRVGGAPYRIASTESFARDPGEREQLARIEHDRWMAERRLDGWRAGPERDDERKIHDCLVPFDALPKEMQENDYHALDVIREEILHVEPDLSAVTVRRDLWVGITGHIDLTAEKKAWLVECLTKKVFPHIKENHPNDCITLVSGLAPGADILFAEVGKKVVLRNDGMARLIVPRPVPFEQYLEEQVWGSEQAKFQYEVALKEMASRSEWIVELMPQGVSRVEIAADPDRRKQQYQRLGAYLVERCNVLVAVFDGRESETGGTGEVLGWARNPGNIPKNVSSLNERQRVGRTFVQHIIHLDPETRSITFP